MAFRAPLLGYNTNVRHKGKLYHIQTEDSGIDHPHVITHLFADGGRILASKKTSYAERVGSEGLPDQVKKLMQGQHKAMFISLRDGIFDEDASDVATEAVTDPRLRKPADPELRPRAEEPQAAPLRAREEEEGAASADPISTSTNLDGASAGELPVSGASEPPAELDERDIELQPDPSVPPVSERAPLYQSVQAPARLETSPDGSLASLQARADDSRGAVDGARASGGASQPSGGPRSLFGGDLLSDKSLDEVILNYLATNEKDG